MVVRFITSPATLLRPGLFCFYMFHYTKDDLLKIKLFRCDYRASYANRRFPHKISCNDVLNTLKRFDFRCAYCSDKLNHNKWQLDHYYSKAMGGLNKVNNLAPTCKWCNTMKNTLDGSAFIEKCKKIVGSNLIEHELGFTTAAPPYPTQNNAA